MAIQIGKYKRPGIFLEEYDNSVIATPIIEGITNLVIGVSKKGPVNTPVRITTTTDLESIFGPLDRNLERKGSFFHRTISKMLESSPVYAVNLLLTDDTLDTIEYKSLSTSSNLSNDIERLGAYRRFHDTTGFWKRDTEAFINLTKDNTGYGDRAFSLTNLSDRYTTVFVFHTQVTGFDRTLIEWYGSQEKVPAYVSANDWASDYMVDVVIVGGDWSDYKSLAVDPRWSTYFNAEGLRKDQIRNFANDSNVTALAYYEGLSLIPYFRDANGRNIFIETTINRDTDKTGIFCAFNNDLVEEDFYNGKLDLIGQTIAAENKESIEFLSYKETIMEEVAFQTVPLDLPGNVTAFGATALSTFAGVKKHTFNDGTLAENPRTSGLQKSKERTAYYAEGYIHGVNGTTASISSGTVSITYTIATASSYVVNGDNLIDLAALYPSGTTTLTVKGTDFPYGNTASYASTFILDSTGSFKVVNSTNSENPMVAESDIVLGYATFSVYNQVIKTKSQTNVTLNNNGFIALSSSDYTISATGSTGIKVEFISTQGTPDRKKYEQYRRIKAFNRLVNLIDSPNKDKMTMLIDLAGTKKSMSGMSISNIATATTGNKSFVLDLGIDTTAIVANQLLVMYTIDNEFILGSESLTTKDVTATVTDGVVAKYSSMYSKFYDGQINTGDTIYNNRIPYDNVYDIQTLSVTFKPGDDQNNLIAGNDYIMFDIDPALEPGDIIKIKGSKLNTGSFTIVSSLNTGASPSSIAYQVNENTVDETISTDYIYILSEKVHYLKMYLDDSILDDSILKIEFKDNTLSTTESLYNYGTGEAYLSSFNLLVNSADTNYKETVEIQVPTGYTEVTNKILVDATRYTEVVVGDFLEAAYDPNTLAVGQVARKLTRIVKKATYTGDTSLVEITCDSAINKFFTGTAYQTTRYKKVENYANTYKAISLKGFRIRQASLPDGTETRQTQILNLVAKGTPLFKALTNKEALDFRYLIDSFGNGLISRSKQQLVDICGERLDAFGFINMPSMRAFKNSSSPSFVNAEGVLQAEYIAKGANPASNPSFLYSFGDGAGTTCTGYFMPYLTVDDNGRPLEMPPAAHVATTYMRKHNSNIGGITPWTIAAGVTNGRITNIAGIEQAFTPEDIEWLNGAQMNPIVFKRNRGNVIETENTAQTLYKSALSYIHVREVLIELERELSDMLLDFQWKFNTPDIRAEIKLRADVICETYVSKSGLYNYFNKMDEENNTTEVIDNQIGVLDTYVEPIRGMGVIVNNVTILRTGAIASGGFQ